MELLIITFYKLIKRLILREKSMNLSLTRGTNDFFRFVYSLTSILIGRLFSNHPGAWIPRTGTTIRCVYHATNNRDCQQQKS